MFTMQNIGDKPPAATRYLNLQVLCGHCNFGCCGNERTSLSVDLTPEEAKDLNLPETFSNAGGCRCLTPTGCEHGENRPACCKMAPIKVNAKNQMIVAYWMILNCPKSNDYVYEGRRGDQFVYSRKPNLDLKRELNSRPEIVLDCPIEDFPNVLEANAEGVRL